MSWLLLASQLILGTLLVVAATGKLLRHEQFIAALRLSHLPPGIVRPVSIVVPAVEFGLAMALLLTRASWLQAVYVATACLLGIFTLWMVWVRLRNLRVRCGCFGSGAAVVGGHTIARNLLLLLIALGGATLAMQASSVLPTPTLWMVGTVVSSSIILALLRGLWDGLPSLVLTLDHLEQLRESDQG